MARSVASVSAQKCLLVWRFNCDTFLGGWDGGVGMAPQNFNKISMLKTHVSKLRIEKI